MSQRRLSVVSSKNGSTTAVVGSGIRIMSDSWMPFQPAIDEPSNILPSSKNASSTTRVGTVTCCSLPLVSVNRRSTYLISFSLISFRTSAAVVMGSPHGCSEIGCPGPLAATASELDFGDQKECTLYATAPEWRKASQMHCCGPPSNAHMRIHLWCILDSMRTVMGRARGRPVLPKFPAALARRSQPNRRSRAARPCYIFAGGCCCPGLCAL